MRTMVIVAGIFISISTATATEPLLTRPGWEIGGQLSNYRYDEPGLGVKIWGGRVGVTGAYTFTAKEWFFKVDGRYAYGSLKYQGSGTQDSIPDSIFEVRSVFGRDYVPKNGFSLSPFVGLGYRNLYNDSRGMSSTGAIGYQRYSSYLYVPLGLTSRMLTHSQWVISPTIEYDYFIRGTQKSQLTDAGLGLSDANNKQNKGFGYRFSVMAEKGSWAFGPWMNYWHIEESNVVPVGFGLGVREPQNETREYGVDLKYRF